MIEQFILFVGTEIHLIDAEDLGIYLSNYPDAIVGQVVDDEVYGVDIRRAGLDEIARQYVAGCRLELTP